MSVSHTVDSNSIINTGLLTEYTTLRTINLEGGNYIGELLLSLFDNIYWIPKWSNDMVY